MKNRNTFAIVIAIMLVFICCLASCQPIPVPGTDETTETTTSGDNSSTNDVIQKQYPMPDLFSENLDQYLILGDYSNLKIELNVAVSDDIVEKTVRDEMTNLALQNKAYTLITDRVTQKNDILDINFIGRMNDEAFENGSADNATVSLVENNGYIPGFDKDLYGVMPGETVFTNVTFPSSYPNNPDFAGKEAVFEIKINGIVNVELSDEAIKSLTKDNYSTLSEVIADYRNELIKQNLAEYDAKLSTEIIKQLKEISTVISLPDSLMNYYIEDMQLYYRNYYENNKAMMQVYYGISTYDDFLSAMNITEQNINDNAKLCSLEDIIIISCAKKNNCILSDEEYTAKISDVAVSWGYDSPEALLESSSELYIRTYLTKEKMMDELKNIIDIKTDYNDYKNLINNES